MHLKILPLAFFVALLLAFAVMLILFHKNGYSIFAVKNVSIKTVNIYHNNSLVEIDGKTSPRFLIAENQSEQELGLMNVSLDELGAAGIEGMVFVFSNNSAECFWMKNTKIPLMQAWATNNTITYIYNASPYSENIVCYNGSTVLEIPTIWAGNISIQDKIKIS